MARKKHSAHMGGKTKHHKKVRRKGHSKKLSVKA